jgi:hypothetical protein
MIVDVGLAGERIRVKTVTEFDGKEEDTCYISANREK